MTRKPTYEKHGATKTKAYRHWHDMMSRCYNPKTIHYERYGGRGIQVCPQWKNSFSRFLKDMGHPPEKSTLDRIDNDKDYSPENCRWATRWEQSVNRSDNVMMTVKGVTKPIAVWAKEYDLPYSLIYYRKHVGKWPDEDCLKPNKSKPTVHLRYQGKDYTVKEIAQLTGVSITCIHLRIKAGWPVEEIINRPNSQPYKKPGWSFKNQSQCA